MATVQFTVESALDFIGKNPGKLTGEIAQAFGVETKTASSRLCAILKRNDATGERISRIEVQPDPSRPSLKSFRWYLPKDFPKNGIEQVQAEIELAEPEPEPAIEAAPEPVVEAHPVLTAVTDEPKVEAEEVGAFGVDTILNYLGKHPGTTPQEMAQYFNIEPASLVASRLTAIYKTKKKPPRIDRVAYTHANGHPGFRWYLIKDLPQEELDRRAAEAELLRQAQADADRRAEEARIAREIQEQEEREAEARRQEEERQAEEARLAEEQAQLEEERRKEEERQAEAAAVKMTLAQFPGLTLAQPPGEIIQHAMTECINTVVQVVIDMFQPQLEAAIALTMEKAFQSATIRLTPTPPGTPRVQESKPKGKRPRIIVVGLKPELTHFIKSEFEKLDLDFFPNDCNPGPMRDKLIHADHCYLMTDKISHKHKDVVVKSKCDFTYVSGGLSSLKDNLRALVATTCPA